MNDRTASMHLTSAGIRIGSATVPRQRIEITPDAVALQKALTDNPRPFEKRDLYCMAACVAAGLFVMATAWAGWLP